MPSNHLLTASAIITMPFVVQPALAQQPADGTAVQPALAQQTADGTAVQPALAQQPADAQQPAEVTADSADSEEIIVTAQRREQSLMSVPLSIQAATGEQLANTGIKDLTSLQFTTPGYLPQTNSGFTQIFIRGIGNAVQNGADPSVATFVDDVPRIYGSMADNLVDVERVEVLKGAQGGLYGRNATGGVVNIITRKPTTDEVRGDVRVSYGQRRTFRAAGFLNFPLSERVAISIAAERQSHGPYVKNIAKDDPYTAAMFPNGSARFGSPQQTADFFNASVTPSKLNDQDFWSVRGKLLLEPRNNLTITLSGDYSKKSDNAGQGTANITPSFSLNTIVGLFRAVGITAVLPPGILQTPGKFEVAQGANVDVSIREYGVSATIIWNAPGFDLTSISAYRNQSRFFAAGAANTDLVDLFVTSFNPVKEFTYQELRAVSTFDGPLRLLGGATYLSNHVNGGAINYRLSEAFPISETAVDQHIHNYSVYGEAGYDLTDALSLTVSGRYMREKNEAEFTKPVISATKSVQSKFIPSATLTYKLDGGVAYLRWARGFKTGGVNISNAPSLFPRPTDGSIFGPETVDTYELGYRQSVFDRKVQLTGAIFYNDYRDLQISARGNASFPQITTAFINAKSARTYGAEGSVSWRVSRAINVAVNAGYLNAKFKDFKVSGSAVLAPFDRSGTQMPKAPKWQFSFIGSLDHPMNDSFRLVGNVLVSHTSQVLFAQSALPGVLPDGIGPAYTLVNARLGVKTTDDKFGFAIVADNLFNTSYYTNANSTATGNTRLWGSPRIIRGEVTVKF